MVTSIFIWGIKGTAYLDIGVTCSLVGRNAYEKLKDNIQMISVNTNLPSADGLKSSHRGFVGIINVQQEEGKTVPTKKVALSDSGDIATLLG